MRRILKIVTLVALGASQLGCGTATVHFVSTSGSPNGVLVSDGYSAGYDGYTTATDKVNVGARAGGGEAVGFSQYRPAALEAVSWMTWFGDQTVDENLGDQMREPITFWILSSPFETNQARANNFWFGMQTIYWPERVGILFTPVIIRDATANANRTNYLAFTCGNGNVNMSGMQRDIGFDSGRINVYLVDSVDGSTTRGNACLIGGSFVAIASTAGNDLLSPEIRHDLALTHIDDLTTNFDQTNVMHSASNTRAFLTEGQLFRAHLQPASAVNSVYGARPGQTTRDCPRDTVSRSCPAIQKRLWPDGTFPAN